MIVSDLESLVIRLLLGGILAAHDEGRLTTEEALSIPEPLLVQLAEPGVTEAAMMEFAEVGRLSQDWDDAETGRFL